MREHQRSFVVGQSGVRDYVVGINLDGDGHFSLGQLGGLLEGDGSEGVTRVGLVGFVGVHNGSRVGADD